MADGVTRAAGFLGVGWHFPPSFGPGGAELEMVEGAVDVHESLQILFSTRLGERPMQETFGCNLDDAIFEEVDQSLVNRITTSIRDAALEHETRIRLHRVDVAQRAGEAGVVEVRLEYSVLETNSRFNMVFPFYVTEAFATAR